MSLFARLDLDPQAGEAWKRFAPYPRPSKRGQHSIRAGVPWGDIGFFTLMLAIFVAKPLRAAYET
ncbi:MAG: hypothetical protein ACREP7_01880 [Lysobacter sp.]